MSIDVRALKEERERIKDALRQLENEQRKLETELKQLRQREIRSKRTLEALDTLLDVHDDDSSSSQQLSNTP